MEWRRDCGWGSVDALASLETRGGGSVTSAVREVARTDDAILGFVGTSCGVPGEDDDASGLAIRRPPKD